MGRITIEDYDTDKGHNYLKYYEAFFEIYRSSVVVLLELGMHRGGSMQMWRDYFPHGKIVGVDINEVEIENPDRIFTYQGDATQPDFLQRVKTDHGISQFDLIIDDASHMGRDAEASFNMLFKNHLAPGGIYVVEDWGTGYMPDWPDGKRYEDHSSVTSTKRFGRTVPDKDIRSHNTGMVGFVKSLVDHTGGPDIRAWAGEKEDIGVEYVTFVPGLAFVKKRVN